MSAGTKIQSIFVFQVLRPDMRCPDMRTFSNSSTQSGPFFKFEQKYLKGTWETQPVRVKLQIPLFIRSPFSLSHLFISLFFSTKLRHQFHSCHGQRTTLRKTSQQLEVGQRGCSAPAVLSAAKQLSLSPLSNSLSNR